MGVARGGASGANAPTWILPPPKIWPQIFFPGFRKMCLGNTENKQKETIVNAKTNLKKVAQIGKPLIFETLKVASAGEIGNQRGTLPPPTRNSGYAHGSVSFYRSGFCFTVGREKYALSDKKILGRYRNFPELILIFVEPQLVASALMSTRFLQDSFTSTMVRYSSYGRIDRHCCSSADSDDILQVFWEGDFWGNFFFSMECRYN